LLAWLADGGVVLADFAGDADADERTDEAVGGRYGHAGCTAE
jgi:hypothetical protein